MPNQLDSASSAVKKRSTQPSSQQSLAVVGQPPNFSPSSPIRTSRGSSAAVSRK